MGWIKEINESEADGSLKEVYEEIQEKRGKIANILKIHSLNPQAMRAHLELYLTAMFEAVSLERKKCELLAVVVSNANKCEYCLAHHSEALKHYWKNKERMKKWMSAFRSELSEKELHMVQYAVKLTKEPDSIRERDVEVLRELGFSDREIHDVVLITSYFNFVNRMALGLGVDFSPEELEGYKY